MDAEPSRRDTPNFYVRGLALFVAHVAKRPVAALLVAAALTLAAGLYSAETLKMNSDDSDLISQDEPFRKDHREFMKLFPQFEETTLIVITSDSIALAEDAVDRLSEALLQREDLISSLFAPGADSFSEDHIFLYLDPEDLDSVVVRLAEAQPALTALAEDPSLRGLFREFETSLDAFEDGVELPAGFTRMAERVSEVTEALLGRRKLDISWADEILDPDGEIYRIISVQGRKYFDEPISSTRLVEGIRDTARELGLTPERGVRVRLTGQVPLAHEEMEAIQSDLALAGAISLSLLTVILGIGVRSLRIVVATLVTLVVTLVWCTAYAMLAVGEFNVISAAFGVVLIGLGVDFALHIGLRYEEETARGAPVPEALRRAAEGVGGAVSLCALTSAIGFLSFVPTRYNALGAMGIIAGGGMFLSLIASFSVFPALLAVMGAPSPKPARPDRGFSRLYPLLARHATAIVWSSAALAVVAAGLSVRMTFNFSMLAMRDPNCESMTTLRELHEEAILTDYSTIALAPDLAASEELAARLAELDLVSEVRPPSYYVPDDQQEKLEMLKDAAFFLEPFLHPTPPKDPPSAGERLASLEELRTKISGLPAAGDPTDPIWAAVLRLGSVLDRLAASPAPSAALAELDRRVVSDLKERMDWLRRAVMVESVTFEDLPASTVERLVADDGRTQVTALPRADLSNLSELKHFVDQVASVAPHATGRPAVEAGIGGVVVSAFRQAIVIALVAVVSLLVFTLRNPIDSLMVLVPITLAAFFTIAVGVVIDMPFNMTTVIVIPLVLGLGVDNGIHVFMRVRGDHSLAAAMGSSTPRAVLLSALTTLAAFGSMSVSRHPGLHSLGVLLSVSVLSLIVFALVVLPAMIQVRAGSDS